MKSTFIGGKLKLKKQIPSRSILEIKKIGLKDIKKNQIEERDLTSNQIYSGLDENEENYMNCLINEINKTNKQSDTRTDAEKLFDERRLKRLPEKIKKNVNVTYKQKYENFTKSLSKLPEHYDIPKVGPG